mgnify:FL=1|jgi:hypothetical protein
MDIPEIIKQLETYGFAVDEGVVPQDECSKMAEILDKIEEERTTAGTISYKTDAQVTIDNIHLIRPDIFLNKINIPKVMDVAAAVFSERFILSSFNASRSGPRGGCNPHNDARIPVSDFSNTTQLICAICLDDFTAKNGATVAWPFSHKSGIDVPDHVHSINDIPGKISCEAPRGSVLYTLAQLWHDIGPNLDGKRRWCIHAAYSRWWVKQVYDFPRCGETIFNQLTPEQKILFGFTSRPPLIGGARRYTVTKIEDLPDSYEEVLKF